LIDLGKGVIRILRKENENTYESENRALDRDYVWYPVPIDKVPDFLLDGHSFIVIVNSPCVFIRVSAGQVLQIDRDKDAAPCTIILTTRRKVHICKFLLTCHDSDTLGWRRC
jgi:hypothetical protein